LNNVARGLQRYLHPEAQDWYEREAEGLGRRFREVIDALVDRMIADPRQFPVVWKNVRRALLWRFPYLLFFCFHASRAHQTGSAGLNLEARERDSRLS
jgi:hypothetical protein